MSRPLRVFEPLPKDLATRCERSGLRYFEQDDAITVPDPEGGRMAPKPTPCPGCGRLIKLRVTSWGVCLVPRHAKLVKR